VPITARSFTLRQEEVCGKGMSLRPSRRQMAGGLGRRLRTRWCDETPKGQGSTSPRTRLCARVRRYRTQRIPAEPCARVHASGAQYYAVEPPDELIYGAVGIDEKHCLFEIQVMRTLQVPAQVCVLHALGARRLLTSAAPSKSPPPPPSRLSPLLLSGQRQLSLRAIS
jgi:hypothetical protein